MRDENIKALIHVSHLSQSTMAIYLNQLAESQKSCLSGFKHAITDFFGHLAGEQKQAANTTLI